VALSSELAKYFLADIWIVRLFSAGLLAAAGCVPHGNFHAWSA
jgi:hypothetical protein